MSTEHNDPKNGMARTATLAFAHALASSYRAQLGERLIGAYLIGSLAHGGFSHRYSDIDMALVTEDGLDAATLTTLRALAAEEDAAPAKSCRCSGPIAISPSAGCRRLIARTILIMPSR
jgi:hypothetical protein